MSAARGTIYERDGVFICFRCGLVVGDTRPDGFCYLVHDSAEDCTIALLRELVDRTTPRQQERGAEIAPN